MDIFDSFRGCCTTSESHDRYIFTTNGKYINLVGITLEGPISKNLALGMFRCAL